MREYPVPLGSLLKKSAIEALILCVMRSGVIIASQIDLSEAMITQQVAASDQRGCSKSQYKNLLKNNTTNDLLDDDFY